jgi:TNF receptor-associated protein 1
MLSTLRCQTAPAAARLMRRANVTRSLCTAVRPVMHCSRVAALSSQFTTFRGCASGQDKSFEFKAETRKLLDIVAKSLYTDKEVFIRELISNASDACEKLRYLQSTQTIKDVNDSDAPLCVKIRVDEQARQFIEDTGLGMTREELIENLGTIAKSGSLEFLQAGNTDADKIIGQFGVGFYSTFVVADKVEVFTKTADKAKGEQGYLWSSDGSGTFTIAESPDAHRGTKIVLTLKDDVAEFAQTAAVKKAATKFSSYIDFPLYILEGAEEKELNKQDALWMKQSASAEEHTEFFRYLNGSSYGEPYYSFLYQTDAPLSIKTCFYIPDPDNAPSRLFTRDPEIGVSLHSRRVLVKKQADGVMPKWLHWIKGVIDCEDMPMNISRENMQDTRLMAKLSMAVVRRILRFLITEAKKDGEKYNKFFKAYSYYLKAGVIEDKEANNSRHKDDLMKLMRFETSNGAKGEVVSLEDYLESAIEGQKNIYYFCAPDRQTAMSSPYMEQFIKRGRNVLFMYDDIDEFVVSSVEAFKGSKFVSVDSHDKDFELDLDKPEDEDDKDSRVLTADEQKDFDAFVKSVLKERVQEVKFSDRLVSSPAVVTSMLTPHMRKMMKQMMAGREETGMNNIPMTLEISAKHHVITTLYSIKDSNEVVARMAVEQLYDNACIAAGTLDDPRTLLARLNKVLEMTIYQGAGFDYATNQYISRKEEAPAESAEQPPKDTKPDAQFEEVKIDAKFEEVKTSADGKGAEVKKP